LIDLWKPVVGYECFYEVSDKGKVRSVYRTVSVTNQNGTFLKSYPSKLLKSYITSRGYELVKLCKDGIVKSYSVHRLVALSFLGKSELPEVNHKDGNKLNNTLGNLEWVSSSDNQKHAFINGLQESNKGEDNGQAKLTETEVVFIHYWRSVGFYAKELSAVFGTSKNHIQDILGFRRWVYLKEVV
jgi:hypothetical protein